MRVLFITRKFPPRIGGMEEFSYQLTKHLSCDKKILSFSGSQLNLVWFFPYALCYALIHAREYDVLHLGDGVLCGIGFFAKKICRKPVVITVHGLDVSYTNLLYRFYMKFFFDPTIVVCVSSYTASLVERLRPHLRRKIIPNGIYSEFQLPELPDATDFSPEKISAYKKQIEDQIGISLDQTFILTTVGRLVKRKGVAWFISHIMPQLPPHIVYLVGGSGKEKNHIWQEINKQNLQHRVFLLGQIPQDELPLLLRIAHLFVMPNQPVSHDPEGFGMIALVAGSAGLPVIASRLEGIPDAITDGENGILISPGDQAGWKQTIVHYANDHNAREQLGMGAVAYNNEHFSWDRVASAYEDVYKSII